MTHRTTIVLLAIIFAKPIEPSYVIDVDDILAEDFMPGTILLLENPKESLKNFNNSVDDLDFSVKDGDGSFGNAMETMGFHRSMMNQYLCRNYVAEEIIQDMTLSRIKRRMGAETPGIQTRVSKGQMDVKNQMLQDEGSSSYKDWLSKSTTLEDIYRHYDNVNNRVDEHSEDPDKDDDFNEDYDGHIAGYSFQQQQQQHHQQPQRPPSKYSHDGGDGGMYFSGGGGGYPVSHGSPHGGGGPGPGYSYGGGGTTGHGYGGHPEPEHIIPEQPKYQIIHEESHSEKDHDLSDLFEIALTALAYLAFKLFVIHVIMCISMASNPASTATAMMMPMNMNPTQMGMTGGGTGDGTAGGGTGGGTMPGTGGGGTMPGTGTGGGGTMPGTGTGGGATGTGDGGATGAGGGGDDGTTGMGDGGDGGATGTGNEGDGGTTGTGDGGEGGDGGGTGTDDGGDGGDGGGTDTGTGDGGDGGDGGATGTGNGGGGDADGQPTGGGSTGTGAAATATATGAETGTGTGTGGDTGTGDTGTATATGGTATGRDSINFRQKREIPTVSNPQNQALNELARRVLTTIEAAFVANEDNGNCLRQTLCENNKYSRSVEGNNKILIPVWSLGMSWISGRLTKNVNPATSMLDSLKASVLGLGKANCEIIYQKCNLRSQKQERLRRRKRDSGKQF